MNDMQIFNYQDKQVRTIQKDGELWWVAKDICEVFGETNRNRAMQPLDDDEKGYTQIATPGGIQSMAVVNEPGLYHLLFSMQPEKARDVSEEYIQKRMEQLKAFRRWVTHEVLPALRKHGTYSLATATPRRPPEVSPNGLARLISITRRVMLDAGDTPQDVKAMAKTILDAWCIPTTPEFSKQIPGQFTLFGHPAVND